MATNQTNDASGTASHVSSQSKSAPERVAAAFAARNPDLVVWVDSPRYIGMHPKTRNKEDGWRAVSVQELRRELGL